MSEPARHTPDTNRTMTMKTTIARLAIATSLSFGILSAAPLAQADEKTEAQDRFKRGIDLYEEENFNAALIEFKRAYELVPAYQVLFNIARTCYQLRDYVCALKTYDRYLVDGGAQIEPSRREEVEKEITVVKRRVGTLTVAGTKGSTITVDGTSVGEAPLPSPIQVNEGKRLIRATMVGREASEKMLEVGGGDSINLDLSLREPLAVSPTEPTNTKSATPWWLWGTTGVLVVGAGITGGLAIASSGDADDIRTRGGTRADYDDAESRMRTFSVLTDVLGAAAIVAGTAALILTLSNNSSRKASKGPTLLNVF